VLWQLHRGPSPGTVLRGKRMVTALSVLCGLAHAVGGLTLWVPLYRWEGLLNLATGLVGIYVAMSLRPAVTALIAIYRRLEVEHEEGMGERDQLVRKLTEALQRVSHLEVLLQGFNQLPEQDKATARAAEPTDREE